MLITFSGIDGSGKSTQIALLMKYLKNIDKKPIYLWTRGGYTPHLEFLKKVIRKVGGKNVPSSGDNIQRDQTFKKKWIRVIWLFFALLDLGWIYGIKVRWWLFWGRTIVCDRYLIDTLIDFKLNFPEETITEWRLWKFVRQITPVPDIDFLLLIPVDVSLSRSEAKKEPFSESLSVREKRYNMYQAFAQHESWKVMDGTEPIEKIYSIILDEIEQVK
jgi:dTMP kinase